MRAHRASTQVFAAALIAAAGLVACSENGTTAPELRIPALAVGVADSTPTDTIKPPPASVRVFGQILGVIAPDSSIDSTAAPTDTISFEPIVGARIRIFRNILVNGDSSQVFVADARSKANGVYEVTGLAGGYYTVTATPPAGSGYGKGSAFLAATTPDVKLDVYLFPKP